MLSADTALAGARLASLEAHERAEGIILGRFRDKVATACHIADMRKRRAALRKLPIDLTRAWPRGPLADAAGRLQSSIDLVLTGAMTVAELAREVR